MHTSAFPGDNPTARAETNRDVALRFFGIEAHALRPGTYTPALLSASSKVRSCWNVDIPSGTECTHKDAPRASKLSVVA